MPRLYPEDPVFRDDVGAERTVWEALRDQLPDDVALFAGVGLQDGATEREIDLLVAWPGVGIAVIEVKGGHVTREAGTWWQGSGERRHEIDPVRQVQDARHVLHQLLVRYGYDAARARTAHVVALPHVHVPQDWAAPELPRTMLLDRTDVASAAGLVRHAIDGHGAGFAPLDDAAMDGLVHFLAGSFPSQVEVLATAAAFEDHLDHLTRDQAKMLDHLTSFHRLQVVGGAGTGKTWLALEQARRRAAAGDRVALLCYSRGLGRYLQRITRTWKPRERPAFVGLFHDLPIAWGAQQGADDDVDFFERILPVRLGELADSRPRAELFDTVVVDEAQDFGEQWWPSLVRCLRDPDGGGLFVFLDEAQRVFGRDGVAPIATPPVHLDENLRSTKQIAQLCGSLRDGVTRPRGTDGAPVRILDVPFERAIEVADDMVDTLLEEGWLPGQVALLATGSRHPMQVELVGGAGHAGYWDGFFAGEDVFYGHVLGFKGLERTVVILAVNGFREVERARTLLYTGLSRARVLLVVVGPRAQIEHIGGDGVRKRLERAEVWQPG